MCVDFGGFGSLFLKLTRGYIHDLACVQHGCCYRGPAPRGHGVAARLRDGSDGDSHALGRRRGGGGEGWRATGRCACSFVRLYLRTSQSLYTHT